MVGAVLYTMTDWRQTKHLMDLLAPLVIAAVAFVWGEASEMGQGKRSWRQKAAGAALAIALVANVAADVRLMRDFRSLTISGASDIDGW
jgi:hypothetical protein